MNNRYFIKFAFSGKNYHGWQIQNNAITVQEVLNKALGQILRHDINVVGCGRTDAGVHAREFYAHFNSGSEFELQGLKHSLNSLLPGDIVIDNVFAVNPDAHARFDAISRTYRYYISRRKDPFNSDFTSFFYGQLDVDLMNEGAALLINIKDFASFSKVRTQVKTKNCQVTTAKWERKDNLIVFTITADRFLRNMVRAIVGTLLNLGRHKISMEELKAIIESRDRCNAGDSVPAKGLFLEKIIYPDKIDL